MIISHKYKFIFIKTLKTAGTSIEVFLSQHCAASDILTPINPPLAAHIPRNYTGVWDPLPELLYFKARNFIPVITHGLKRQKFYNHIPASIVQQRIPPRIWDEYFKFCVERNPWDKTLSHYSMQKFRSRAHTSFEEYLRRGKFCLNYPLYTNRAGHLILDRVIKYENLIEELTAVFRSLGIPFSGTLGNQAKSEYRQGNTPYREVFSEEQKLLIEKAFAKEINMHGYSY
jgi:hypothetical protein